MQRILMNLNLLTIGLNSWGTYSAHSKSRLQNYKKCNHCRVIEISRYFWRSLEMPLINCKVEFKLRWNPDNDNCANMFTIKDKKLYVPFATLSAKPIKNYQNFIVKGMKYRCIGMNIKKSQNKSTTNPYRYFLESNFVGVNRLFAFIYPSQNNSVKQFNAKKYYLPKGINKIYNVIIKEKNFYDLTIQSDTKRYEEIRKLTTGPGEDYTTGCLLDYDYIESHYILIAVDLSRQRELDTDPKVIREVEFFGQFKKY